MTLRTGSATRGAALLAMAAAIIVAAIAPVRTARAHSDYDRSSPGAGAVVAEAPERLDVWFTQELFRREGANTLIVTGPGGERADSGDIVIDDADRTRMSVGLLPGLPPGEYTVAWASLSAVDGDTAGGTFAFTIDPAATPAPATATPAASATAAPAAATGTASPPPAAGGDGDGFPWWALIALGAIAAAGGIGAWALLTAPSGDETGP